MVNFYSNIMSTFHSFWIWRNVDGQCLSCLSLFREAWRAKKKILQIRRLRSVKERLLLHFRRQRNQQREPACSFYHTSLLVHRIILNAFGVGTDLQLHLCIPLHNSEILHICLFLCLFCDIKVYFEHVLIIYSIYFVIQCLNMYIVKVCFTIIA